MTSPFVTSERYDEMISKYLLSLEKGFDSLMAVTAMQSFIWDNSGPINYDINEEKWPRTQTLNELFEVNSSAFIASDEVYKKMHNRIGKSPYLFQLDKIEGFDIDWEDDFTIAESLISSKNKYLKIILVRKSNELKLFEYKFRYKQ